MSIKLTVPTTHRSAARRLNASVSASIVNACLQYSFFCMCAYTATAANLAGATTLREVYAALNDAKHTSMSLVEEAVKLYRK